MRCDRRVVISYVTTKTRVKAISIRYIYCRRKLCGEKNRERDISPRLAKSPKNNLVALVRAAIALFNRGGRGRFFVASTF